MRECPDAGARRPAENHVGKWLGKKEES